MGYISKTTLNDGALRCATLPPPQRKFSFMWISDLLRKITKGPNIGETFRDYIGCYTYGIAYKDSEQFEFGGAPTSLQALEHELADFLSALLEDSARAARLDLPKVHALQAQLGQHLHSHVSTSMEAPFADLGHILLFVRKGVRERRKVNGQFIE
ncbi:MAG: hypothetical protein ACI4QS_13500 [Comamonas sp.]